MVLVFRYVFKGSVYERFCGFLSPEGKYAETLAKCIMDNINPLLHTSQEMLIAETYMALMLCVVLLEVYRQKLEKCIRSHNLYTVTLIK